jgi:hypothetical protein
MEINNSSTLYVYTPGSQPNPAWKPTITTISPFPISPPACVLTGTQLNGVSAGASYGDDAEMDSNYPIVEYIDASAHVHFAQPFDRSSTGVQTGALRTTVSYDLPSGITEGAFGVQVVTNGIASSPVLNVLMDPSQVNNVTLEVDPNNSFLFDVFVGSTLLNQSVSGQYSAVDVTMARGAGETLNILSTLAGLPVNVNTVVGDTPPTINIGNGQLAGIQTPILLENLTSHNNLTIDDSTDSTARTATWNTVTDFIDWQASGQLSGLSPATITWNYSEMAGVTIKTGTAAGNVISVLATAVATNIDTIAATTINEGGPASSLVFPGQINLSGPSKSFTINEDDSADMAVRTAFVDNVSVSGLLGSTFFPSGEVAAITLNGGSGADTFDVEKVLNGTSVTINTGSGTNAISVGNTTDGLGDFQGALSVNGGSGENSITLNDTADTVGAQYLFETGFVERGFSPVNYANVQSMTLDSGSGGNSIVLLDTPATLAVTINAGTGADTVQVSGSVVGNLDLIQGPLTVNGQATTTAFVLYDQSNSNAQTYTLGHAASLGTVKRTGFSATYTNIHSLQLTGSSGANTYEVENSFRGAPLTVIAGSGNNIFNVCDQSDTLSNLNSLVTINGGSGTNTLTVNDQRANIAESYTVSSSSVKRPNSSGVSFTGIHSFTVNGGVGGNAFSISNTTGPTVTLNGGTGTNTLDGPNANSNWVINTANGGQVGPVTFRAFANLVGGSGVDVFAFNTGGSVSGTINGGTAPTHQGNWLDYSTLTTSVTVNLATGAATDVNNGAAGAVTSIQNVHGGNGGNTLTGNSQGNILIGGSGNDRITRGSGPSLLIGDLGADTITGGSGGDILIGDSTLFDLMTVGDETALMAILAEWQSADSYATRFTDIDTGAGGGLNATAKLNFGTTVTDDSAADTVTAAASTAALDWFFQGAGDVLQNVEPGEHINNNTPAAFQDRTVTSSIPEGSLATLSGTITDPDAGDSFTLVVNWGDGTPAQTYIFPPGSNGQRVSVSHRYGDEGNYTIALSWTDPIGPANHATLAVTVTNVGPVVQAGGDVTLKQDGVLNRTGSFTDPGADTWTAMVDYGDGTGLHTLILRGHDFLLHHKYGHPGTYHVVVTVTDDDGAVGTDAFTVTVN